MNSTAALPPLDIKIFVKAASGRFGRATLKENRRTDREGYLVGHRLHLEVVEFGLKDKPQAWAHLPAAADSRWISGKPYPGRPHDAPADGSVELREGQDVFVIGRMRDKPEMNWWALETATHKSLPFPGFCGGPMTRYENVIAWMPLERITSELVPFPQDFLEAPTPLEAEVRRRLQAQAVQSEALKLAIINDGTLFLQHFQALAVGERIRAAHGKLCSVNDWIAAVTAAKQGVPLRESPRAAALYNWCYSIVLVFARKNPDAFEADMEFGSIYEACKLATCDILAHYADSFADAERSAMPA